MNDLPKITNSGTIVLIGLVILAFSCSGEDNENRNNYDPTNYALTDLPRDTGGVLKAYFLSDKIPMGYYIYTPSGYDNNQVYYPMMVFLHGSGEKGNSMLDTGILKIVLNQGLPKLIATKTWAPRYPMVVVSPQCHTNSWEPLKVYQFIEYITNNFRINKHRIYLTGLSMGGFGTFNYLEIYSTNGNVAAAVPICGGGHLQNASRLVNIPLWAFHGDADQTVDASNSINMVNAINNLNPTIRAKLTIYPGVGHNSWDKTYYGTGMGTESKQYDPFDTSIYDWAFKYSR